MITFNNIDFKFGMQLGFTKRHHKITPREKTGRGPRLGKLCKIVGFPFNISATAEDSDFKFGMRLGFAKGHHEITPRGQSGSGPGLGKLPNIWGFLCNISATAEIATSNLICCLGLPRAIIKSHPEEKWAWHWARGAS